MTKTAQLCHCEINDEVCIGKGQQLYGHANTVPDCILFCPAINTYCVVCVRHFWFGPLFACTKQRNQRGVPRVIWFSSQMDQWFHFTLKVYSYP